MSSATAKPKPIRRAVGAVLIPAERLDEWYARASAMLGLNEVELGVLVAIAEHYRQLEERGFGMSLSHDRMAYHLNSDPIYVRWAVNKLVEVGLVGVEKGGNGRANAYAMTLPRRIARAVLAAAIDDPPAPPF